VGVGLGMTGRLERWLAFVPRVLDTAGGRIGAGIVTVVMAMTVFAPLVATSDPFQQDLTATGIAQPPGHAHLLGTDELGRDIFSRILFGGRISLGVAFASLGWATAVGVVLGTAAGVTGGSVDHVIMRLTDALLAFPVLILAIAIAAAVGRGVTGLVLAIGSVNVPVFTRLVRAQSLQLKDREFVLAAAAIGASTYRKIVRYLLPNLMNTLIVQVSVSISFAIIIEAGLSFLGLGVQAPAPSWGLMVATARLHMAAAPHMMMAPAAAISVTVLGFNLLGDAFSDALDPRRERGAPRKLALRSGDAG
jgi:peptide/nickel transport system permease protein